MGACLSKPPEPELDSPSGGYLTLPERLGRSYSLSRHRPESSHSNGAYLHSPENDLDQTVVKRPLSFVRPHDADIQSHDTAIQTMVEAFQPCIEQTVKVSDVVPRLHEFLEDEEAILNMVSQRESVRVLLERLKESEEVGRWQAFVDSLTSGGYPYLVRLLNGHTEADHTTRRKLLKLLKPELIRDLDVDTCMDKLLEKDVLNEQDLEEIHCERDKRGHTAACLMLLDAIPRRAENWFEVFVRILKEIGLGHFAETFEGGNLYVTPPTRCKMKTVAASDYPQICNDCCPCGTKTPPPGYTNDYVTTEITKNAATIKKLSERKERKAKQLDQRTTIDALRRDIRDLDEKLVAVPLDDASSLEFDLTSENDSCFKVVQPSHIVSPHNVSPLAPPRRYTNTCTHDDTQVKYTETNSASGMGDAQLKDATLAELMNTVEALRKELTVHKKEQRNQHDVVISELKHMRHDITVQSTALEDNLSRINQVVLPPKPHTMHPIDSAFSDCSVISCTSF